MKHFPRSLVAPALVCLLVLTGGNKAGAEIRVHDDLGAQIALPGPATRIVSLAPHLTELMFYIGAGERLVGVDMRSDFPPAAASIRRVGRAGQFDMEAILALRPDLVLAWDSGNPAAQLDTLHRLGLVVYHSEPRQPLDIPTTVRRFGLLTGLGGGAEALALGMESRLARLREQYAQARPVRVFYQVWNDPLITFNGEHLVSQGLALCGGENVFAGSLGLAPRIALEAVIRADPQVIIASGVGAERPPWLDAWRRWPQLAAIRGDQLYAIHPDLVFRHTARFFDGLERLCDWIGQARQGLFQAGTK